MRTPARAPCASPTGPTRCTATRSRRSSSASIHSEPVAAGPRPPLTTAEARERVVRNGAGAAILVEGWSDQAAVEALARRRGDGLPGVEVLPIGGATNVGHFAQALGPPGLGVQLAGLYDLAEERHVARGLQRAGIGAHLDRARLQALGFFACETDLEDELIRAVGAAAVLRLLDAQRELDSFERFRAQPAQAGRDIEALLRRFMGTRAGRKIRYGSLLVDALDLDRVPRPLDLLLAHVRA